MPYTAAVDIGKWTSGLAVFRDQTLLHAREVYVARTPSGDIDPGVMARELYRTLWTIIEGRSRVEPPAVRWVVEKMVDYDGKGARADDLEHLRSSVKALAEIVKGRAPYETLKEVRAASWKGGISKPVTAHRVLRVLSADERARIDPWTKETWDAVGIGLFAVYRASRGVVPITS